MSNQDPCPFCCSTSFKVIQEKEQLPSPSWIECQTCKARGPVTMITEKGTTAQYAYITWGKRPAEKFLKQCLGWLISVHAANASDYEAKSISTSKRGRQIGILQKCVGIALLSEKPDGFYHGTPDEQIEAAGKRAEKERQRLAEVEAKIQSEKKAAKGSK